MGLAPRQWFQGTGLGSHVPVTPQACPAAPPMLRGSARGAQCCLWGQSLQAAFTGGGGWEVGGGCNLLKMRLHWVRMVPDQTAGVLGRELKTCGADTQHRGEKLCEDSFPVASNRLWV